MKDDPMRDREEYELTVGTVGNLRAIADQLEARHIWGQYRERLRDLADCLERDEYWVGRRG